MNEALAEKTILVVDDEHAIRESLREVLSDEGYRVLDTNDCSAVLEMIERDRPGLLVLSIRDESCAGLDNRPQDLALISVQAPSPGLRILRCCRRRQEAENQCRDRPRAPHRYSVHRGKAVRPIMRARQSDSDTAGRTFFVGGCPIAPVNGTERNAVVGREICSFVDWRLVRAFRAKLLRQRASLTHGSDTAKWLGDLLFRAARNHCQATGSSSNVNPIFCKPSSAVLPYSFSISLARRGA